jgi:phosphate-selective porin OprO/OprP
MKHFNGKLIVLSNIVSLALLSSGSVLADSDIGETSISGVIMLDYAFQDGLTGQSEENSSEYNSEIRKARLDIKHKLRDEWSAKLQLSFDDEEQSNEIGDAYIRYSGLNQTVLTIGQFKEPFGLENMTSSKNTTFLERSMASRAFASGKNQGLMFSGAPNNMSWAVSLMEIEKEQDDTAPFAVDARFTWAPIQTSQGLLHLGGSTSLREMDGEIFEVDERIELHSSEKIIESGEIPVERMQMNGLEVAMVYEGFSLQAEYLSADIEAIESSDDMVLDGYYIQASLFLSKDQREYKKGIFSGVKPSSVDGAWELTARYSELNTREAVQGRKVTTSTLGLNYYVDKNLRLITNLLLTESSEEVNGSESGNALAFRAQYRF